MILSLCYLWLAMAAGLLLLPASANAPSEGDPMQAAKEFRAYLDADWKRWMELYPEFATSVGYPGQNRRWLDNSPQGIEARKAHLAESLRRLRVFSRRALPEAGQLDYDLYRELLETAEEGLQYGDDPLPFGLQANMPTIEALITYAVQQGLMPRRMTVEELFHKAPKKGAV